MAQINEKKGDSPLSHLPARGGSCVLVEGRGAFSRNKRIEHEPEKTRDCRASLAACRKESTHVSLLLVGVVGAGA